MTRLLLYIYGLKLSDGQASKPKFWHGAISFTIKSGSLIKGSFIKGTYNKVAFSICQFLDGISVIWVRMVGIEYFIHLTVKVK